MTRTQKNQFSDFDNVALFEQIRNALEPYGFQDSSWNNDACPSLMAVTADHGPQGETFCHLYLNYAAPELREAEFSGADIWFSHDGEQVAGSEAATDLDTVLDVLLPHGLCNGWNEPEDVDSERAAFMGAWLDRNAAHIAQDWERQTDGAGVSYWRADGELEGQTVEYRLGCGFDAGLRFDADEEEWQLTAYREVGAGNYHVLSQGQHLPDILKLKAMDLDIEWSGVEESCERCGSPSAGYRDGETLCMDCIMEHDDNGLEG